MQINSESRISHPLDRVYKAYRDQLPLIAQHMPDIKAINVRSRIETPKGPHLLNEWIAHKELPSVVASIVKPEMMRWEDHAEWHDAETYVAWRLVIPAFPDQVRCSGRNTFVADGPNATRVILTGDLEIKLDRIPGVPGFMAKKIAPSVEEFFVKLITPNLAKTNQSLQQFLDAR